MADYTGAVQVRVFTSTDRIQFEKDVSEFLAELDNDDITINDMHYSVTSGTHVSEKKTHLGDTFTTNTVVVPIYSVMIVF